MPRARRLLASMPLLAHLAESGYSGWANVQGANYVPSYSFRDVHDIFTSSKWSASVVDRELGYAKSLAVNSLRVFLTYGAYMEDALLGKGEVFFENYKIFQHLLQVHRLSLMVTMAGHSLDCGKATNFIKMVVGAEIRGVVIAYEADNEPAPYRIDYVRSCLLPALLKANQNPEVDVSVGFAHVGEAVALANNVTTMHWHSYNGVQNGKGLHGEIKQLQSVANKFTPPKQLVLTEWHARPCQPLAGVYPVIRDAGVAGYLWAEIIVNSRAHWDRPLHPGDPPFQGMIWPNGTLYDDIEEGECMRTHCKTLTYVHHCCNLNSSQDDLFVFSNVSGSDWQQHEFGSPVYSHGRGPREASLRQTTSPGATVTIGPLPEGTKRIALYLPMSPLGAGYTVTLGGRQIYKGTTSGRLNWLARVILPVASTGGSVELVVDRPAPATMKFNISGATFFTAAGVDTAGEGIVDTMLVV